MTWRVANYVSDSRPQAALDLLADFESLIKRLSEFPGLGQPDSRLGNDERRTVLRGRWVVVYKIRTNKVIVLRIRNSL